MNEFLRFTDINTASVSTALVLMLIFFYLGYKASGNTEQVFKVLWSAWLTSGSVSFLGRLQGWW